MPGPFYDLLDDLAALQRSRGVAGTMQKSFQPHGYGGGGFDVRSVLERQRRSDADAKHGLRQLERLAKSAPARLDPRHAQAALLKAKLAEVQDQLGAAARAGKLSVLEIIDRQKRLNRFAAAIAAVEQGRPA